MGDDETIVRVIIAPYHVHRTKRTMLVKAFAQPPGSSEVSVIRQLMTDDFCKQKAKAIVAARKPPKPGTPEVKYRGLAAALTSDVRKAGAEVADRPPVYPGHANIIGPDQQPERTDPSNPPDPMVLKALDDYYGRVHAVFTFYPDDDPGEDAWTGPSLKVLPADPPEKPEPVEPNSPTGACVVANEAESTPPSSDQFA